MLAAIDIAVIAVLLVSALLGLWRGFIVEVMSLLTWMLAFWSAWMFGETLAAALPASLETAAVRLAVGYIGCFVGMLALGGLLTWLLTRLVKGTGLSGTDRLLGFVFGLLRGLAVCLLLLLVLGLTPVTRLPEWHSSVLIPLLQPLASWLRAQLPPAMAEQIQLPALALPAIAPPPAPTP